MIRRENILVPVYDRSINVVLTDDMNSAYKLAKTSDDDKVLPCATVFADDNDEIWCIFNMQSDSLNCMIDSGRGININVIGHEIFHMTILILNSAGMKLSNNSEEGYAYLHGWLMEHILGVIKRLLKIKSNIRIRHK